MDIHQKPDAKLKQRKDRPLPTHLQPAVGKETAKLNKNGHMERATNINKNCFVRLAIITVRTDKTAQMSNKEEIISRISSQNADGAAGQNFDIKT